MCGSVKLWYTVSPCNAKHVCLALAALCTELMLTGQLQACTLVELLHAAAEEAQQASTASLAALAARVRPLRRAASEQAASCAPDTSPAMHSCVTSGREQC